VTVVRSRVALVIPTLDEEESIGGALGAVPRDAVDDEIIIADSGSVERTVEWARAGGRPHRDRNPPRLWPRLPRRRRGGKRLRHPGVSRRRRQRSAGIDPGIARADHRGPVRFRHRLAHPRPARTWQHERAPDPPGHAVGFMLRLLYGVHYTDT
jgi:glycosyltransferase involved in cell wall biosynthesis